MTPGELIPPSPGSPGAPTNPSTPSGPLGPIGPGMPGSPSQPLVPLHPSRPGGPRGPSSPAQAHSTCVVRLDHYFVSDLIECLEMVADMLSADIFSKAFAKFNFEFRVPHHPWEAGYSGRAPESRHAHVSALPLGPHEPDTPHVTLGNHSHMNSAFCLVPQNQRRLLISKWGLLSYMNMSMTVSSEEGP